MVAMREASPYKFPFVALLMGSAHHMCTGGDLVGSCYFHREFQTPVRLIGELFLYVAIWAQVGKPFWLKAILAQAILAQE